MKTVQTELLDIAYFDDGPPDGDPVLLLHGWPDDAHGMLPLAQLLHAYGYRTIVPFMRGFGPTRFLHETTFRDGRGVALAQDAVDLLDALGIDRFFAIGHDWGARAGYHLAAIAPDRLRGLVTLGLAYAPGGVFAVPDFKQSRLWWYQWFMTTNGGVEKVYEDPRAFARILWDTWSPIDWYEDADFAKTAESFRNPDWLAITLHAYRSRWQQEPVDPRYRKAQTEIERMTRLAVKTVLIFGYDDNADTPPDFRNRVFDDNYHYKVLPGMGHFLAREAPDQVRDIALEHFAKCQA
jgi:pimeloyl-ACP methyl ester carboxylesterase